MKAHASACAMVALFAAGSACAQTATAQRDEGAGDDGRTQVSEEIVVTAQRRAEPLKDVPFSVTALGSGALVDAGIDEVRELATVTPGLFVGRVGSNVQPVIRGIGSAITQPGSDTNVALYIDGVIQPIPSANAIELNNIDRVEVLKGPQGTLFGRNATGGAISIVTRQPAFSPVLEASAGYGSFNELRGDLYATAPLSSAIAIDGAVSFRQDDGYIVNTANGHKLGANKSFSARTKLLIQPSDALSATLSYAHTYRRDTHAVTYHVVNRNTIGRQINPAAVIETARDRVSLSVDPFIYAETDQFAGTLVLDTGPVKITSITSHGTYAGQVFYDQDATAVNSSQIDFPTRDRITTQDFFADAKLGQGVGLLAGLSYYHGDSDWLTRVFSTNLTTPFFNLTTSNQTTAWAGFGELTVSPTDALTLIAGVRYSTERKHSAGRNNFGQSLDARARFDGWSPRASVRYALSPATNVYATYSRGFKSGLIDIVSLNPNPVRPETNDAVEVGFKHASPGFTANVAAYHYWYNDIQVQSRAGNLGLALVQNAATARIYGIEGDISAAVSDSIRFSGGVAINHARFGTFNGAVVTAPRATGGNATVVQNLSGTQLPRAPDFTANATIFFTQPMGSSRIEASLTGSYNGGFAWDAANRLREPAYFLLNGRIRLLTAQERFAISLWAENLTDATYSLIVGDGASGDTRLYAKPRRVGITLGINLR